MAEPITLDDLRELLLKSELLTPSVLEDHLAKLRFQDESPADAAGLAALAVRDNVLTAFQAKLLLQGKWKNFFLSGKYKVLDHLGSGGMGAVFLCEHRHMRRRVAVKVLPPDPTDPNYIARYQREAQAVAMLDHPNIVRAFDLDRESRMHFLVMEFVDGASLQWLVDSRGPLSVDRAVNYVAQAALGLQHAADAGLVHRDVKPGNLMLDWAGTIKLLDLGLARFARRSESSGDSKTVLGTADYLAPEQARSNDVDARADIYALGAVAYFLLTGQPPFPGGSVAQKLMRHQTEVPTPVDSLRPDVPSGVANVVSRMLSKSPGGRPQSGSRVIAELKSWVVDVPPPTPEEMPPSRLPGSDMDTNARRSTMALMSRSSRNLLFRTIAAVGPADEPAS